MIVPCAWTKDVLLIPTHMFKQNGSLRGPRSSILASAPILVWIRPSLRLRTRTPQHDFYTFVGSPNPSASQAVGKRRHDYRCILYKHTHQMPPKRPLGHPQTQSSPDHSTPADSIVLQRGHQHELRAKHLHSYCKVSHTSKINLQVRTFVPRSWIHGCFKVGA